jgi:poly-gamma-glutamate synthesis protein (capsule biosynthesis protein)
MDFGVPGLTATMTALAREGIAACGAGKDTVEARRPVVIEDRGVKVGIIGCCEAQFGVTRRTQAGVAEFGPWVYHAIRDLRRTVDSVIVSVHAAVEDAPWPSPYVRELCHSFIDAGAAVVHGHHAHVPQGYEKYGEGVIFYGMGNLAVDPDKWRDYPNGLWSLAADVDFTERPVLWRPITLEIRSGSEPGKIVVEESSVQEQAGHKRHLEMCNRPFNDDALFDAIWQEVALRVYLHHGARYMGFAAPPRRGRRASARASLSMARDALVGSQTPQPPSRQDMLMWYHLIACESHRQMLATALGVLSGEISDLRTGETRQLADEMMPWSRGVVPA